MQVQELPSQFARITQLKLLCFSRRKMLSTHYPSHRPKRDAFICTGSHQFGKALPENLTSGFGLSFIFHCRSAKLFLF